MHHNRLILQALRYFLFALALVGCVTQKTSTTQSGKYSEDLSSVRPKVELPPADTTHTTATNLTPKSKETVPAKFNVNGKLDATLDSINKNYVSRGYVDGYSIQVFSGDQSGALSAKRELTLALPDLTSEVIYDAPTFRVKTGQYLELIQAQKDYLAIKKYFPGAIVIPQKIPIN